jgi:hypothetical protein
MNQDTLIFIDSYLSNSERAETCKNLISQLREYFPEYKLALLNKFDNSWKLDSLVDYYVYHSESVMVGMPPQWILDQELYERQYVYVGTEIGTCENWMPLIGVTDHVSSIYDSFILSSRFAKSLGYKKVFKIEYDTILDKEEAKLIKKDINQFQDYLLYGKRQEGQWAKPHHYLADIHIIGYSVNTFLGFDLIKSNDDFWKLCKHIGYYGKWIEYIIPTIIEYQRKNMSLEGIVYETSVRKLYPNTHFDVLNSPSYWTKKWDNIPKICRVSYNKGKSEVLNEVAIFFWNDKEEDLEVNTIIRNSNKEIVYSKQITLKPRYWSIDKILFEEELFVTNYNTRNGKTEMYDFSIKFEDRINLPTRFLYV